jgi:hypothetical protein
MLYHSESYPRSKDLSPYYSPNVRNPSVHLSALMLRANRGQRAWSVASVAVRVAILGAGAYAIFSPPMTQISYLLALI